MREPARALFPGARAGRLILSVNTPQRAAEKKARGAARTQNSETNMNAKKQLSNAIEVRGLKKRFGDVQAVAGIDFEVQKGELFGPDNIPK